MILAILSTALVVACYFTVVPPRGRRVATRPAGRVVVPDLVLPRTVIRITDREALRLDARIRHARKVGAK